MSRDGSPACSRRLGSAFLARPHLPRPTAPLRTGARGPHLGLPLAASAGKGVLSESAAPGLSACIRLLTIAGSYRRFKQPSKASRLYAGYRISTFKGDDQQLVCLKQCCNMCNAKDTTARRMQSAIACSACGNRKHGTNQRAACHGRSMLAPGPADINASPAGECQLHPWLLLCNQQKLASVSHRMIKRGLPPTLCCILAPRGPCLIV